MPAGSAVGKRAGLALEAEGSQCLSPHVKKQRAPNLPAVLRDTATASKARSGGRANRQAAVRAAELEALGTASHIPWPSMLPLRCIGAVGPCRQRDPRAVASGCLEGGNPGEIRPMPPADNKSTRACASRCVLVHVCAGSSHVWLAKPRCSCESGGWAGLVTDLTGS